MKMLLKVALWIIKVLSKLLDPKHITDMKELSIRIVENYNKNTKDY
ncbi:hypothetical protein HYD70_02795 [Mycoplasmopsis bovis]|nr:hypothetical protein [Mycoplasmopsis bovis]QQH49802.1 hypothetical protein HYD70_02795 [Mycoplasmopsis bovis]